MGFYVIGGSQSLRRGLTAYRYWQHFIIIICVLPVWQSGYNTVNHTPPLSEIEDGGIFKLENVLPIDGQPD